MTGRGRLPSDRDPTEGTETMGTSPDDQAAQPGPAHADHPFILLSPVLDAWDAPTDFRFEEVNEEAATWIGLPAGMVVGRTAREIFSPAELAPLMPNLIRVCETRDPWVAPSHLSLDGIRRVSLTAEWTGMAVAVRFHQVALADEADPAAPGAEVEALRRLATAVGAGLTQEEVFGLLEELLFELYEATSVGLARLTDEGIEIVASSLEGVGAYLDGPMPLPLAVRTGQTARCDDHAGIDDPIAERLLARGMHGSLAAPIDAVGRRWGGLAFATPGPPPPGADQTLEAVAALMGVLVRDLDARRTDPSRQTADGLTGLPDHAAFRERLADAWQAARAAQGPLSLAVFDVDHLAELNTRHGHATGDAVIAGIADRLRAVARDGEVARIGGEQFAWIIPGADGALATHLANRVRLAVSSEPFPDVGEVTISGGVAEMVQAARPAELLRLAEGAMSWAKTHGRDLVLAYDPGVVEAFSAAEWAERLDGDRTLASIETLARAVDAKDRTTHEHSERVATTAASVARALGWQEADIALLRQVARVHDVGKIAIPDEILGKAGPLTPKETERMRSHAERGADIVSGVLTPAQVEWVRHHHERWDGTGYPGGMAGAAIPEGARIIGLADAFDVMRGSRRYTPGVSLEEALEECRRCSGTHFWPAAVDALMTIHGEV